ncbi:MAG: divergent polysaccharide deacetylase family protein [Pseudomonadota bacterium]
MVENTVEELVEDAEIEGLRPRSSFWSFVRGTLLGVVACGAAAIGVTLSHPLPEGLPGVGTVEIEQPAQVPAVASADSSDQSEAQVADDDPDDAPVADVATQEEVESAEKGAQTASDGDAVEVAIVQPLSPVDDDDGVEETSDEASPQEAETGDSDDARVSSEDDDGPADTTAVSDAEPASESDPQADAAADEVTSSEDGRDATAEADEPALAEPVEQSTGGLEADVTDEGAEQGATETAEDTADEMFEIAAISPAVKPAELGPPPLDLPGPALDVNSRSFDAPGSAPLLAVVLDDAGNGSIELDKLGLLTMPLTLAIRPEGSASREMAAAARDARHEVLAQLPMARSEVEADADVLRSDLSPDDLLARVQRYVASFPEAIGATSPDGALMLRDASAMRTVLEPLAEHGFAWIDLRSGAGSSAAQLAEASGVAYAESDRFVGSDATDEQVFTTLENAAFQARQKGTAIVYVTASGAALTAILRWGLVKDRRPVWFAPVSAVLKRRAENG